MIPPKGSSFILKYLLPTILVLKFILYKGHTLSRFGNFKERFIKYCMLSGFGNLKNVLTWQNTFATY